MIVSHFIALDSHFHLLVYVLFISIDFKQELLCLKLTSLMLFTIICMCTYSAGLDLGSKIFTVSHEVALIVTEETVFSDNSLVTVHHFFLPHQKESFLQLAEHSLFQQIQKMPPIDGLTDHK